jgi:hypothetical protein
MTPLRFWTNADVPLPDLYIDLATEQVGINSLNLVGFNLVLCLLSSACSKPDLLSCTPDYVLSPLLPHLIKQIPDFVPPWDRYVNAFQKFGEDSKDDFTKSERFGAIAAQYFVSMNSDKPLKLEKLCAEAGIDLAETSRMIEYFKTTVDKDAPPLELPQEDQALSLSNPVPLFLLRSLFDEDVYECQLYRALDEHQSYGVFAALTNNSFASEVKEGGLLDYFSSLFNEEFGRDHGLKIMHQLFFMLLMSHEKRVLARVYALEILKVHHTTLLPSLTTDTEGFIDKFGRFVYRKLVKRALILIDARPSREQLEQATYTIVPSEFFKAAIWCQTPN